MELEEVIEPIELALNNMNKNFCKLSKIDYKYIEAANGLVDYLKREKYLERPIAYEFYHQLRKLIDEGDVDFGGPIIQAEVDKNYQHCFKNGKMPDFIINQKKKAIQYTTGVQKALKKISRKEKLNLNEFIRKIFLEVYNKRK